MMRECWSHLASMLTWHSSPFPLLDKEKCIHGDPAYPLHTHLQCPFRLGVLTRQMEEFNASTSSVRTSVEWWFGDLINYFKFLDYKKISKLAIAM